MNTIAVKTQLEIDYLLFLQNTRNYFYSIGNSITAVKIQKQINELESK